MVTLNYSLRVAVSVPHISRWQHIKPSDLNGVKRCQRATSARRPSLHICSAATLSPQQVQKRSRDGAEADEKGLSDYKVLCYRSAVERMVQCSSASRATGFHCAGFTVLPRKSCWTCCVMCGHPLVCLNLQCPEICA